MHIACRKRFIEKRDIEISIRLSTEIDVSVSNNGPVSVTVDLLVQPIVSFAGIQ